MRIFTTRIHAVIISLVILLSNNSESVSFAFHPSRHSSLIHPTCRPQLRRRCKCPTQTWSRCTPQQHNNRYLYVESSFSLHSTDHLGIDNITETNDAGDNVPSMKTLLQMARRLREKLYGNATPSFLADPKQLAYPTSTYDMAIETNNYNQFTFIGKNNRNKSNDNPKRNNSKSTKRGFCNWLLPQTVMIGQYPGQTPETYGPSTNECRRHIQTMVRDANISLFCCLQTEVPPQDDCDAWTTSNSSEGGEDGEIYLEPWAVRREFPRPFTRYGPLAILFAEDPSALTFLHCPIEDLSVPSCKDEVVSILWRLLCHLDGGGDGDGGDGSGDGNGDVGVVAGDGGQVRTLGKRAIYIHCWGGRGRAGLVGSCLVSLLFPELTSRQVLEHTQCGYDTREGADRMPMGLRKSPQTEEQRRFVREFVDVVRREVELVKL